jgi:hypothetical protein
LTSKKTDADEEAFRRRYGLLDPDKARFHFDGFGRETVVASGVAGEGSVT